MSAAARFRRVKLEWGLTAQDVQQMLFFEVARGDAYSAAVSARVLFRAGRGFLTADRCRVARRARHEAYTSAGMHRVKGALGGVYYE